MVALILATVIALAGALAAVRCFHLAGVLHIALAVFTWCVAQITLVLLLAGVALQRLAPGPVMGMDAALSVVMVLVSLRYGQGEPREAWQALMTAAGALGHELRRAPWAGALIVLAIAEVCWLTCAAIIYPPNGYDALAYHLPAVATWIQAGHIGISPYIVFSNVYPADAELFYTWLMLFPHNDALVGLGQIVFACAGAVAVADIGRTLGLKRATALAGGSLYLLTPILVEQSGIAYTDVAFASVFLVFYSFVLRHITRPSKPALLLVGLSAGLTLGIKSSAPAYVGVGVIVLAGAALYRRWIVPGAWRTLRRMARDTAIGVGILAAPMLLLAAYWYLRTWAVYDNPVYPFTVQLAGHTIFAGWGTVQQVVVTPQTPQQLLGQPLWKQLARSWRNEPPLYSVQYATDQRLGGLGPQWLFLELPALALFAAYAVWRRRDLFLALVLPFVLILLVQPAAWWSRYTLFIVAPGIVALLYFMDRASWRMARRLAQMAIVMVAMFSVYHSTFQGPLAPAAVASVAAMPSRTRTIGSVWYPEYHWLDTIPAGARIGTIGYDDARPFTYPLFGRTLQHVVVAVQVSNENDFLDVLRQQRVDYLFTTAGSTYAQWAEANASQFYLIDTTGGVNRVYRVDWQTIHQPSRISGALAQKS